jgi:RNA recognition motif-containing protein
MDTKLYVGNLSYSVTEDELRELFAQAGNVTSVAVIKDRDTGQSKGFAFVEFGSQADAQKAISRFNGQKLGERTLTVNLARPKEERSRSGGYGGGSGNRGGYGGNRDRRGGGTRRY